MYVNARHSEEALLPQVYRSLQGEPGDLARSQNADQTLQQLLVILDNYYDEYQSYDALSRKLYLMAQWKEEMVATCGMRVNKAVWGIRDLYPTALPEDQVAQLLLN